MINPRELRVGNYVLFDKQVLMIKGVAEGSKVMDDLRNDAFKEIIKSLMKQ